MYSLPPVLMVSMDRSVHCLFHFHSYLYWQVYFHKTVLAAEQLLLNILKRAKEISSQGVDLFAAPDFKLFLKNNPSIDDFKKDPRYLNAFSTLDDHDIYSAIKVWRSSEDHVLSTLCKYLISRDLYKIELHNEPISPIYLEELTHRHKKTLNYDAQTSKYFVFDGVINNNAYNPDTGNINILTKSGQLVDVAVASDGLNVNALSRNVKKYFICYPINEM